jgi:hypothetical protein
MNRFIGFTAIGLVAAVATTSRADYAYTTAIVPPSQAFGATSVAGFFASSGTNLVGNQNIALAVVTDTTATPVQTTDMGIVNYKITLNLIQTAPDTPGMGSIVLTGFLTFTRSDTKGELSTNTVTNITGPLTIGNQTYALSGISYAAPTVNAPPGSNSAGTIGGYLTVTPVPEPASVAMLGVGGLLLVAPRLRRLVRRIARS